MDRPWMARATSSLPVPLSGHEDGRLEVGDLRNRAEDLEHLLAFGQYRLELAVLLDLLFERAVLTTQRFTFFGLAKREDDLVGLEGLADVVVGARLHRVDGQVDVAVRTHHDDRRRVLLRDERRKEIHAPHPRHANVGQDDVGVERVQRGERGFSTVGDLHLVAVLLQQRTEHEADIFLVVDDEHAAHGYEISSNVRVREKTQRDEQSAPTPQPLRTCFTGRTT
jgi:hypothetical protein